MPLYDTPGRRTSGSFGPLSSKTSPLLALALPSRRRVQVLCDGLPWPEATTLGYEQDWYEVTPEQFLVGDFHHVL